MTLYTADSDSNEVTIEVDAGTLPLNSNGGTGSDGKIYGIYQPSSQPSSQPTMTPILMIFVTSEKYQGYLGEVFGADNKCQDLANIAGLDGTYRAWISQSASSSPAESWSQANPNRPYYLVDGTTKVADNWGHLTDAKNNELYHQIDKNENGQTVTEGEGLRTWTNTNWDGNQAPSTDNCDGWTTDDRSKEGKYGWIKSTTHTWSWAGGQGCHWEARLYCFQQNT